MMTMAGDVVVCLQIEELEESYALQQQLRTGMGRGLGAGEGCSFGTFN